MSGPKLMESSDHYSGVIAHLSEGRRVVACRDGIQWIIQNRVAAGHRGGEWKARHYCVTRKALIRLCDASGEALAIIEGLPSHCHEMVVA